MQRICVFCGSRVGNKPIYQEVAQEVGKLIAKKGLGLVYGAGNIGLMGAVANAALAEGGEVIGVIPKVLVTKEIAHGGLSQLHVVDSMEERKALMAKLSDAFITLPGGYGTLDELFEMLTWSQLGIHNKPSGLLNIDGFYDHLLAMLNYQVENGFLASKYLQLLLVENNLNNLMEKMLPLLVSGV